MQLMLFVSLLQIAFVNYCEKLFNEKTESKAIFCCLRILGDTNDSSLWNRNEKLKVSCDVDANKNR